jgi:hypothetical protein
MMNLITELYLDQKARWPNSGRHILAQFDADSVVVYQAYAPAIGHFAARHGYFGGGFGMGRMSWIKPNFLWMMYRSGWGMKENQEVTLAVRLRRDGFDEILRLAVHSSYSADVYSAQDQWKQAVAGLLGMRSSGGQFNSGSVAMYWRNMPGNGCWKSRTSPISWPSSVPMPWLLTTV